MLQDALIFAILSLAITFGLDCFEFIQRRNLRPAQPARHRNRHIANPALILLPPQ